MPVEVDLPIELSKNVEEFRNYVDSDRQEIVVNHYKLMRTHQNLAFSDRMAEKYTFDKPRIVMSIREAFRSLETYVDSSDPDVSIPNLVHMLQTAEGIRAAGHPDWMQLVGLIHDMGKVMFLWGCEEDGQVGTADGAQWALGGDTWVVGCKIPDTTVFPEFNKLNADCDHEIYDTEYGIYSPNCGFENLKFAYGHDEYVYRMVVANNTTIPKEGLAMLRYHSCYPWHTGGSYRHLMNDEDHELMKWVLEFNKFDLYTKDQAGLKGTVEELWPYYQSLIEKYFPTTELKW